MNHAYANNDTWTISLYYTAPVTRWLAEPPTDCQLIVTRLDGHWQP